MNFEIKLVYKKTNRETKNMRLDVFYIYHKLAMKKKTQLRRKWVWSLQILLHFCYHCFLYFSLFPLSLKSWNLQAVNLRGSFRERLLCTHHLQGHVELLQLYSIRSGGDPDHAGFLQAVIFLLLTNLLNYVLLCLCVRVLKFYAIIKCMWF